MIPSLSKYPLIALLTLALTGCVTPQQSEQIASEATTTPEADSTPAITESITKTPTTETTKSPDTSLSPELLYNILLAAVANQRQQPEVALESLSDAVYQSRDRNLNIDAIQLAMRIEDYQKAIELARLLLFAEPDNYQVHLALANAQIKNDDVIDASQTLLSLAEQEQVGDEAILQEISTLVARQSPTAIDTLKTEFLNAAEQNNPILVFTAALIMAQLEDGEQYRTLLDKSLALEPSWETAAMLKLNDIADYSPETLTPWANDFLTQFPQSEKVRTHYAQLLVRQSQLTLAIDELDRVLKQNPDAEEALFAAAVVNMELENYDLTEAQFSRYIELGENPDQARLYLAELYVDQSRDADASTLLRQIYTSQYYLDAQIMLASIVSRQSNVDAGLSVLRNISAYNEDEAVRIILEQNLLLRNHDQIDRSLALLSKALEKRPENPDLLYNRGLLAAELDRLTLVEQDMRKLIELQPDNAHAYNALGYTLADQTTRYDEALALISKALEYRPEDPFILDSMGWVQYRVGNLDSARDYLERALALREDAEIAAHLGEVLWMLGNKNEAKEIWTKGREWSPDNNTLNETIERLQVNDQQAQILMSIQQTT